MTRIRLLLLPLAILAVLLGAAMASPVAATDSNHPDYWLAKYPNAVACYSYGPNSDNAHGSDDGKVVTLNPFQPEWPGDRWEVLVVKAGSAGDDGNGNAIYELPEAGVEYAAPDGKDISHWIVCKGETPEPTPTPEVTPSLTPTPEVTPTPTPESTPMATPTPTATITPSPTPTPSPTTSTTPSPSPEPTPETSLVPPTETTQPTPPSELPQTDTLLVEEHPSGNLLFVIVGLLLTSAGAFGLTWKRQR